MTGTIIVILLAGIVGALLLTATRDAPLLVIGKGTDFPATNKPLTNIDPPNVKLVEAGGYSLSYRKDPYGHVYWLENADGEGMSMTEAAAEKMLGDFFTENF